MGIDPSTHKPKNDTLLSIDGQTKNAANLSHMAQWESARLEAEARLVRESKLRSHSFNQQHHQLANHASSSSASTSAQPMTSRSLNVLKGWNGTSAWSKSSEGNGGLVATGIGNSDLESPTSTLTFSENVPPTMTGGSVGENSMPVIEFVGGATSGSNSAVGIVKEEGEQDWKGFEYKEGMENNNHESNSLCTFRATSLHDMSISMETSTWSTDGGHIVGEDGFTNLLLNNSDDRSLSDGGGDSDNAGGSDYYEDNKNYWNSILNLVNSSPSDSPMF